jgi:hypothetical protein
MALILEANYSKKIGLPGYSSHQFSLTLKTEISDPAQVQSESARLYALLQSSVDQSLKQEGWLPEATSKNGHVNGNGTGYGGSQSPANGDHWNCSGKQRELIEKIVQEHKLDKGAVEQLAQDRFGKGVKQLNKLEASGLIDELFERHGGGNHNRRQRFNQRPANSR